MGQNLVPPVNIPNPHENRLIRVVHLPQNGTIGFDPQPYTFEGSLRENLSAAPALAGLAKKLSEVRRSGRGRAGGARHPQAAGGALDPLPR